MTLHEQLVNKIHKEQEEYLAEIEKLPPREIINKAYEISHRAEFADIFENVKFDDETMEEMLKSPNIIAEIYDEWLGVDDNMWEMLEETIEIWRDK